MKILDRIIQILINLSNEEKKLFLKLAEEDETFVEKMWLKIYRLEFAVNTGNILLLKKIMDEDDGISKSFIKDLQDRQKIIQIRKTLKVGS